jgi:cytidylate kinase
MHASKILKVHFISHPRRQDDGLRAPDPVPKEARLAVAISSQTGSGAFAIAERLAVHLGAALPAVDAPWKVFDRTLMARVLEEHHLPTRLARFLPEDANSTVGDVLDELFGLHPSSTLMVQQVAETILKLARAGNVILIGWGANVITRELPNVFHVRLVGSLEERVARVQQREHLTRRRALALIGRQDRGRKRYVKRHFGRQVDDALLYDLTLNTDRFSDDEAARWISAMAVGITQPQAAAREFKFAPAEADPGAWRALLPARASASSSPRASAQSDGR